MSMTTSIQTKNKKDLSGINNLKDLQQEIAKTKIVVKQDETRLKQLVKQMPEEAVFAATNGAIHIVAKKGVPGNIFNLVRNSVGLVMNIRRQKKGLRGLVTQGKELILYTALNQLLRMYHQKRNRRKLTSEYEG
jgi:hypothetical protein